MSAKSSSPLFASIPANRMRQRPGSSGIATALTLELFARARAARLGLLGPRGRKICAGAAGRGGMTVTILAGHVLDALATMPDESVHMCCTSPPYFGLRSYNTEPQVWGGATDCEHEWEDATVHDRRHLPETAPTEKQATNAGSHQRGIKPGDFCIRCGAWRGSLGLEPTVDLYVEHMVEVFREVRRVLRPDGTLWLNLGDSYAGSWGAQSRRDTTSDDPEVHSSMGRRPPPPPPGPARRSRPAGLHAADPHRRTREPGAMPRRRRPAMGDQMGCPQAAGPAPLQRHRTFRGGRTMSRLPSTSGFTWNKESLATLRRMICVEGKTFKEIAGKLGTSKNSCIAKARRLDIRPSAETPLTVRQRKQWAPRSGEPTSTRGSPQDAGSVPAARLLRLPARPSRPERIPVLRRPGREPRRAVLPGSPPPLLGTGAPPTGHRGGIRKHARGRNNDMARGAEVFRPPQWNDAPITVPEPFSPFFAASLESAPVRKREWIIDGLLMRGTTCLLAGPPKVGKSLALQQMLSAIALGKECFGRETVSARCFGLFCEDSHDELARRQAAINLHYGIEAPDYETGLSWEGRDTKDGVLIEFEQYRDKPVYTDLWHQLWRHVDENGIEVVALDPAGVVFGGHENFKRQVTVFVRELNKQAARRHGGIILAAHPAKNDPRGYAGSAGGWDRCGSGYLCSGRKGTTRTRTSRGIAAC